MLYSLAFRVSIHAACETQVDSMSRLGSPLLDVSLFIFKCFRM